LAVWEIRVWVAKNKEVKKEQQKNIRHPIVRRFNDNDVIVTTY